MKKGDQKGITRGCNLVWKIMIFWKFQKNLQNSNQNTASGDPPFVHLFSFWKKATSQLSQGKKYQKILKTKVRFYTTMRKSVEKWLKTWTVTSGRGAHFLFANQDSGQPKWFPSFLFSFPSIIYKNQRSVWHLMTKEFKRNEWKPIAFFTPHKYVLTFYLL